MMRFPWSNFHELNLDWFLAEWERFKEEITGSIQAVAKITASARSVPSNQDASVTVTGGSGTTDPYHLDFSIPRGAEVRNVSQRYGVSASYNVMPTSWSDTPPQVPAGSFLWAEITLHFTTGVNSVFYINTRFGVDGSGAVSKVNGKSPVGGNITINAGDILTLDGATIESAIAELTSEVESAVEDVQGMQTAVDQLQARRFSNENLLINSWFLINQRNATSFRASSYGVDRWKAGATKFGSTISAAGIGLNGGEIYQLIDNSGSLCGKTVTVSVLFTDGTETHASGTLPENIPSGNQTFISAPEVGGCGCSLAARGGHFAFVITGGTKTVKCAKLESGSFSTLFMDAAPSQAVELLKCQRFFINANATNETYASIGIAVAVANATAAVYYYLPQEMRTTPSVTMAQDIRFRGHSAIVSIAEGRYQVSGVKMSGNIVTMTITCPSGSFANVPLIYWAGFQNVVGQFTLDSELTEGV